MKNIKILILLFLFFGAISVNGQTPFGEWKTIAADKPLLLEISKTTGCNQVEIKYKKTITETPVLKKYGDTLFKRTKYITITNTFNKHETKVISTLDSVFYTKEYSLNSNIVIINNAFNQTDIIKRIINKSELYNPKIKSPLLDSTWAKPLNGKERRLEFEKAFYDKRRKATLFIGLSYTPSIAYRQLLINTPFFPKEIQKNIRQNNEALMFGNVLLVRVGINVYKVHLFYVEGGLLQQGFKKSGYTIDWKTGLPNTDSIISQNNQAFTLSSTILVLGYSYRPYNIYKCINFASDIGLYGAFSHNNEIKNNNRLGIKIGAGVTIKPSYWSEFKIMPTLFYDFTHLGGSQLKTRLYNIGISIGWGLNCATKQKKFY